MPTAVRPQLRRKAVTPARGSLQTSATRTIDIARSRAAAYTTQFTGANRSSQQLGSWLPFKSSPDADLSFELDTLVSRSRDLARNNGIAQGAIQTYADNIVGTNFKLVALPDWRALGQSRDWAEDWANNVEGLWRTHTESTSIDAARRQTFAEMTITFLKSAFLNGAGLALPIWQPERYDLFATRMFLLEPDRLSNPNDTFDSVTRRGGIEIDEYGRPLAYWIRNQHPGEILGGMLVPGTWQRIPAQTGWGRKRVIHAAEVERPGQTRGKPIFASVMQQFKMLDKYASAELDAAVTNALIAAFIKTPAEFNDIVAMLDENKGEDRLTPEEYFAARALPENRIRLKSGSVVPLYPGEELQSFNPSRPASGFGPFMETTLRHIATGLHMPYELLVKDFSKTNYSSARASMLEAWRFFKGKREWLARNWARPVYELWLEEAINAGLVDAPDFYLMRAAYTRSRWIGAARGWVDPVKEAKAAQIRIEGGLSTMEQECAEQEGDWEEVMHQQKREQDLRQELGLPTYGPPESIPAEGAAPAPGSDADPEPEDVPAGTDKQSASSESD